MISFQDLAVGKPYNVKKVGLINLNLNCLKSYTTEGLFEDTVEILQGVKREWYI